MVMQTMIFIPPLSGKKMTALPRQEDVDVAEADTEVATVVTVDSIIMGNVEDIEEATMAVTVEDIEEVTMAVTVEDTEGATMVVTVEDIEEVTMAVTEEDTEEVIVEVIVEATVEANEVASEASEVANEVESVVATVAVENGGMESVAEVEEAVDEVIEEVVMDRVRILQFLHDCLTAQSINYPKTREPLASISYLLSLFPFNDLVLRKIVLHRYPVSSLFFLTIKY